MKLREWTGRRLPFAAAVLPYAALCLSFSDAIPMWDARVYADCVKAAARFPFDYDCGGHPTAAWARLISLLRWMAPESYWPLVLASVALGIAGLWAFHELLQTVFEAPPLEAALLTACVASFPVVAAGTVDLNPDHGVWVFFLLGLRALLRGRRWQAALFGLLLAFSKEPGVLLWSAAILLWAAILVARRQGPLDEKLKTLGRAWPLLLPVAAFGAFVLYGARGGRDPLWHELGEVNLLETFTTFSLTRRSFVAQLRGIFVLQFAWALTALALVRWIRMAARALFSLPPRQPPLLFFFDALLFGSTLLLTRYQTFLNLRYYLALVPLLAICGYAGLRELAAGAAPRAIALGVLAALFFASCLRTIDPISRAAMGTFPFGEHPLLDMTRKTGECCGHGRDQLGYNLEHLHLGPLLDLFLEDEGGRRAIAAPTAAGHHTFDRTPLRVLTPEEIEAGTRPPELAWVRVFFAFDEPDEARIRRFYELTGEKTYDLGGYRLTVAGYRLRATSPGSGG